MLKNERRYLMKFTSVIKENYEFRRIYSKGRSTADALLVVYVRTNKHSSNRMGITVSTKVGHAVVRNKIKRRIREIYRLNEARLIKGCDIIIVARSKAAEAQYSSLEASFLKCCRKLGILEESGEDKA